MSRIPVFETLIELDDVPNGIAATHSGNVYVAMKDRIEKYQIVDESRILREVEPAEWEPIEIELSEELMEELNLDVTITLLGAEPSFTPSP